MTLHKLIEWFSEGGPTQMQMNLERAGIKSRLERTELIKQFMILRNHGRLQPSHAGDVKELTHTPTQAPKKRQQVGDETISDGEVRTFDAWGGADEAEAFASTYGQAGGDDSDVDADARYEEEDDEARERASRAAEAKLAFERIDAEKTRRFGDLVVVLRVRQRREVPGRLWLPPILTAPAPLVLLGSTLQDVEARRKRKERAKAKAEAAATGRASARPYRAAAPCPKGSLDERQRGTEAALSAL